MDGDLRLAFPKNLPQRGLPPSIMAILKLLHMDRYLNLVEDEPAAQVVALGGSH